MMFGKQKYSNTDEWRLKREFSFPTLFINVLDFSYAHGIDVQDTLLLIDFYERLDFKHGFNSVVIEDLMWDLRFTNSHKRYFSAKIKDFAKKSLIDVTNTKSAFYEWVLIKNDYGEKAISELLSNIKHAKRYSNIQRDYMQVLTMSKLGYKNYKDDVILYNSYFIPVSVEYRKKKFRSLINALTPEKGSYDILYGVRKFLSELYYKNDLSELVDSLKNNFKVKYISDGKHDKK